MIAVLAVLGGVVSRAGVDLTDDEGTVRQTHLEDARGHLARILNDDQRAVSLLSFFGWN
jgi:hypothetical protein